MKVISGTLKGRVIPTQKTHDYRPTLSRIREDVFNLIQHNKELNINLEKSTFGESYFDSPLRKLLRTQVRIYDIRKYVSEYVSNLGLYLK